jgi:hypothetical protein
MNTFDDALQCMDGVRKNFTDARMRHDVEADLEARRRMMLVQMARIEETTRRFEHAAMKGNGMIPKVEIPALAYHSWAAKFKMKDMAAGITNTTGYECWQKGSGFREWWIKNNERLQYREAKKCQQSSIIVPATKYTPARAA